MISDYQSIGQSDEWTEAWRFLRSEETERGLEILAKEYRRSASASNTIGLGVGYLWTRQYDAAWSHFQSAIAEQRWTVDTYFGMAGAAKWCAGDGQQSVECWRSGLHCNYGDANGASVGNRLLLFMASILQPETIQQSKAIELLKSKLKDRRIHNWPGPLVELCLGTRDLEFDLGRVSYAIHSRQLKIGFYVGLLALRDGELTKSEFNLKMKDLSDCSQPQLQEYRSFTSLIWNEEFFIARHESEA